MKKFRMLGGGIVAGENNQEIAEAIRDQSFNKADSLQEFMEQTARACIMQRGKSVRTDNVGNFIRDLKKEGYLIEER